MTAHLLIDLVLKATLLLVIACGATLLLRRAAAATRHLIWTLSLFGIAALPALAWAPGWHVPWLDSKAIADAPIAIRVPAAPVALAALNPVDPAQKPGPVAEVPVRLPPAAPPEDVRPGNGQETAAALSAPAAMPFLASLESQLLLVWAIGVVFSLLTIGLALLRLRQLAKRCIVLSDGPLHAQATQLARELGLRRSVRLLSSHERTIPMTWGVFCPTLLLPSDAAEWSDDRLRMVMLHELAHIARWDCLTHLLGHFARCLYWFHPLAWLALMQQRREQEKACDDRVVAHGARAEDYAEHLLAVTAQLPVGYFASTLALGMSRSSRLGDRLTALLDASRPHRPASFGRRLSISVLALCLVTSAATARRAPLPGAPIDPLVEAVAQEQPMTPDALKKLEDIRKKLREFYVDPLDDKQLTEAAIKGLLQGLKDPYTDYLPPEEFGAAEIQMKGSFFGIGAQLKMAGDRLTIVTPLDHSPALKAGLRAGDVIEAIDGQPTRGIDVQQAVKRILGANGTTVKLKVVRDDGVVEDVAVTRGPIRVATVHGFQRTVNGAWRFMLDDDHKVGYMRITQFSPVTAKEARSAIESLQKDGLKGLIIDLRFCPGGMLDQALSVCKLFVKEGTLLTIKGAGKQEKKYEADAKESLGDFPVVVLVNEQTASAAELVAGVLRDRGRALVLGTRTFGKGSVQQIVKFDDGGALRVTSAYYYLPNGQMIHKRPGQKSWGIDPDDGYYLPLTKAQADALQKSQMDRFVLGHGKEPAAPGRLTPKVIEERFADPQLAAAARTLVAKLTGGEFLKVGQPTAQMDHQLIRLEEMRQKRNALLQDLQRLERDIDAATRLDGSKK